MTSRQLERVRSRLEEIDSLREAVVGTLKDKTADPKRTVIYDYKLRNFVQQIQSRSVDILNTYKASGAELQAEMSDIQAQDNSLSALFFKYYTEAQANKDYNQRNCIEGLRADSVTAQGFVDRVFGAPLPRPEFTEAEEEGRCVDLQAIYTLYVNLKAVQVPEIDSYLLFIRDTEKVYGSSVSHKLRHYREYLELFEKLGNYLIDFYQRIQPLGNPAVVQSRILAEFEEKYTNKDIDNYFDAGEEEGQTETYFCEACQHTFTNQNTYKSHFSGKKHLKNASNVKNLLSKLGGESDEPKPKQTLEPGSHSNSKKYKLSRAEHICQAYRELLEEEFEGALNAVRQKQTAGMEYDDNESVRSASEDEKDDENKTFTAKNMPIGWDGKPIPMWVYKLHGLGIEYKCEICGNYSYWGRQAFEKHFTEWKHTYGMKCLKIPNTPHFREITSINDALVLHKKLLMDSKYHRFNNDEEEFEDSEGNILNKRTYDDLKREGLL